MAAEMLRLGADPQGLLDPPEVDELLSLYHEALGSPLKLTIRAANRLCLEGQWMQKAMEKPWKSDEQ